MAINFKIEKKIKGKNIKINNYIEKKKGDVKPNNKEKNIKNSLNIANDLIDQSPSTDLILILKIFPKKK